VGIALAALAVRRERSMLICVAFFVAHLGVAGSPVIQSGVRYILPALPPLVLLAAAAIDAAVTHLRARAAPAVALAFAAALQLGSCLSVAPYYLDYYNAVSGGPRAALARHRFIFGWWGEGIGAAVAWFNAHAARGATVHYNLWPGHVVWLRDDVQVRGLAEAEWALVNRFQFERPPPGFQEVYRVEVVPGALLTAVYHRPAAVPAMDEP
jgi:hypothetical protein